MELSWTPHYERRMSSLESDLTAARALLGIAEKTPGLSRLATEVAEALSTGAGEFHICDYEPVVESGMRAFPHSVWLDQNGCLKLLSGSFEISGDMHGEAFGKTAVNVTENAHLGAFDHTRINAGLGNGQIIADDHATIFFDESEPMKVVFRGQSRAYVNLFGRASQRSIQDQRIYPQGSSMLWIPSSTNEAPWITSKVPYAKDSPIAKIYHSARKTVVRIGDFECDDSGGTGFFISPHGQIATADHVVEGLGSEIKIEAGNRVYNAEVAASDPDHDLAILKIKNGNELFPYVKLSPTANVPSGRKTLATGYASATEMLHVYPGHVVQTPELSGEYQLVAKQYLHRGASGGFVADQESGEVIGINSGVQVNSSLLSWNDFARVHVEPAELRAAKNMFGKPVRVEHLHNLLRSI
jgi:Trypsin-like peptidase domain